MLLFNSDFNNTDKFDFIHNRYIFVQIDQNRQKLRLYKITNNYYLVLFNLVLNKI